VGIANVQPLRCALLTDDHDNTTRIEKLPPHEAVPSPVSMSEATPHYFGLTPPTLLFAVATSAIALAVLLAILSHWVAALVLALVGLALLAVFVGSARRKPDTELARTSVRGIDRARERASWLVESFAVRSTAAGSVRRLRAELLVVEQQRNSLLRDLGDAVYREDKSAAKSHTDELRRLELASKEKEEQMQAIADSTRERLDQARLSIQPTLIDAPVPEPAPPPDEGTLPEPPAIPEPYPPPDEGTPPQPDPAPDEEN
jgi:type IV secretory pathway VirB3-like protein